MCKKGVILILAIISSCITTSSLSQTPSYLSINPQLRGNIDLPGSGGPITENRGFAYVGYNEYEDGGICIIDITDPLHPVVKGKFEKRRFQQSVGVIDGMRMYVAGTKNLSIYDLTTPTLPVLISNYVLPFSANGITESNDRVFIGDLEGFLRVIDTSNLQAIREISTIDLKAITSSIMCRNDYLYVTSTHIIQPTGYGQTGYLWIIDVSKPSEPRIAGKFHTVGSAYDVVVDGHFAYVCDDGNVFPDSVEKGPGLDIIDIADPVNPRRIGRCQSPSRALGVVVENGYAYLNAWDRGVQIIDIKNPARPKIIGSYFDSHYKESGCLLTLGGLALSNGFIFLTWDNGNKMNPKGGLQIVAITQTPARH